MLLKGAGAVFTRGLSLGFVALVSGSRVTYHRTFKSARPDVFDWPDSYRASFSGTRFQGIERRTHAFGRSLAQYPPTVVPDLVSWFERMRTIDDVEVQLPRQIASPLSAYRGHSPRQNHVLAFVRAARGDLTAAREILYTTQPNAQNGSCPREVALMNTKRLD
jgi:hypothetical protein